MRFFPTLLCTLFASQSFAAAIVNPLKTSAAEASGVSPGEGSLLTDTSADVVKGIVNGNEIQEHPRSVQPDLVHKRADKGSKLYLAVYRHLNLADTPETWSLIVGPQDETPTSVGWRYRTVRQRMGFHKYMKKQITMDKSADMVGRLLLGEVQDTAELEKLLQSVRVVAGISELKGATEHEINAGFDSRTWVRYALKKLEGSRNIMGGNSSINLEETLFALLFWLEELSRKNPNGKLDAMIRQEGGYPATFDFKFYTQLSTPATWNQNGQPGGQPGVRPSGQRGGRVQ
ncbi:hypothetical protein BU24DRAFT_415314 [Aaosphaeria arxii CBS 175.79]|uniref:Uncharacterized protein n=1 Tax=Aaosphaeria arxii CBS 175.79 TaxID=1450172 RepID=A0A6A5X7G2_9PLEO|nr:uncharacterized protein BU24DRAFT_415314 [Aaosphaeria arxii CBS 175.79]KAF2008955.1 hypothetical protein BU24DRAFT_415314 [Aaosphaeria arxii CBS 175.79]